MPPTPTQDTSINTPAQEYSRDEVEQAWRQFVAAGEAGDWNVWTELHTEDCVWVEHDLGTFKGHEAIRKAIHQVMAPVPMMRFPVEWHMIEGNRVVYYPWQELPDPANGGELYRFGCITILEYAGNGRWSYQEDVYNAKEGAALIGRWIAAGGKLASS